MKRTILKYGLISGAMFTVMMSATVPFADRLGHSYLVGYTTMVVAFMLVFFGVRSRREKEGNGYITFGKAFVTGLGIALIACVFYVLTWEVIYFQFMPDFMEKWAAHSAETMRAAGATSAMIELKMKELKHYKELYDNPFINAAMTFLEPLPVGLVIALLSAAILRKRPPTQAV